MSKTDAVETILKSVSRIAVVGCSRDEAKDAHTVPAFLQEVGYEVIPVNPHADRILDEKCYDNLLDANDGAGEIDLVDVFRPSEEAPGILKDTLRIDTDVLWLQLGIRHDDTARKAEEEGLTFIQDRCIYAEYKRLFDHATIDEIQ
jgi:hypothetical protein